MMSFVILYIIYINYLFYNTQSLQLIIIYNIMIMIMIITNNLIYNIIVHRIRNNCEICWCVKITKIRNVIIVI